MNKFTTLVVILTLNTLAFANNAYTVNVLAIKQDNQALSEQMSSIPIINNPNNISPAEIEINPYNLIHEDNIVFNKSWKINPNTNSHAINIQFSDNDLHGEGILQIYQNRYFDYKLKLNISNSYNQIALFETRRARNNQITYIDHPLVGFLITVTKD